MKHQVVTTGVFYKGVTSDLKSPQKTPCLSYEPGTTVSVDIVDDDPAKECGAGINFQRTIADALRWGPKVVSITVPWDVTIIDTGTKLRASTVKVVEVIDLMDANLMDANLRGANLMGAHLMGAYLGYAHLMGAHLMGAYLGDANLRGANLRDADLRDADLRDAHLGDANLRGANLRGANLMGAYLSVANLRNANLSGANLRNANLSGANLSGANLSGAYGNGYTTLPSGWKVEKSGLIVETGHSE